MAGHLKLSSSLPPSAETLGALAALGSSGGALRSYMQAAAAAGGGPALRAGAGALLLSADAGMGPPGEVVVLAREALDAIMKME